MAEKSFANMRVEPRWQLKSTVSVFSQATEEFVGLMVNWSEQGLMFSTYQPMKKGEVVKLELVDMVSKTGRRNAHCTAEVMWSHELTPSLHGNGCVIREGSDSLNQMMRDYCKVS